VRFCENYPGGKVPLVANERVCVDEFLLPSPSHSKPSPPFPVDLSPSLSSLDTSLPSPLRCFPLEFRL